MVRQFGSAESFADQSCYAPESLTERLRLDPTPIDEATGVSFPIVTQRELPPIGKSTDATGRVIADWNHTNHPRERLVRGSPIEKALRDSRVEWVHRDDHNSYHKQYYGHVVGGEAQTLKRVIFNVAGFVPDRGLQYDGRREAKIVPIDERTRLALWQSGRIKIVQSVSVRDGLMDVALRKDFNGINESTIDEFLHTTDERRRFVLGSNLLSLALSDVTTPLKPLYREMHERQQLRPDAPKTIGRFALKLVSHYRRTRALGILEGRLKTA